MARGDDLISLIIALADMVGSKIVLLCTKTRQTPLCMICTPKVGHNTKVHEKE